MTDRHALFSALRGAVLDGDDAAAGTLAAQALAEGVPALEAIEEGLVPGIREAGQRWEEGDYFLPELVTSAQAMKAAMAELQPALGREGSSSRLGTVVLGTVEGDIHDIGKTLVGTMLSASGFEVFDEGASVPVERFLTRAHEVDADLVCASALLTTTMPKQRDLAAALKGSGLRARLMVGGAPVTRGWADAIGAAGYADNALTAVTVARALVGRGATA
ncbi:MAG TPA: corrinoid protein [Thermoanaerobaculaceae bacterium]|nr:corrinoid protein [Thermoanaerobaculaceae bacterium]